MDQPPENGGIDAAIVSPRSPQQLLLVSLSPPSLGIQQYEQPIFIDGVYDSLGRK